MINEEDDDYDNDLFSFVIFVLILQPGLIDLSCLLWQFWFIFIRDFFIFISIAFYCNQTHRHSLIVNYAVSFIPGFPFELFSSLTN